METKFKFSIQCRQTTHTGEAQILEADQPVVRTARQAFADAGLNSANKNVTVREIGTAQHEGTTYGVYESYIDSGSDDYFYFATPLYQEQK